MAVNLESLLPQAFGEASPPLVPSSGTETESLLGDIFSSTSMYGNENLPFLDLDSNSMSFDPSLFKDPALQLQLGDDSVQYLEGADTLYQPSPSGIFNDSWMTTPVSLPLTPSEDPLGRATPSTLPTYSPSPVYPCHTPSPAVPLTPESLVSPESSCNGEELAEVLSLFSGSAQCDVFPDSEVPPTAPGVSHTPSLTPSTMCNDSSSSLYSSYASLLSGPTSPCSPSSSASSSFSTPYALSPSTPATLTPSSLTHHSITPQDTIRDLLARNSSLSSAGTAETQYQYEDTTEVGRFEQSGRASSSKRTVSEAFESSDAQHCNLSAKKAKTSRSRKRVTAEVKKERKREQNKTAALRYRQKKKEEKMEFESQQAELEEKNENLKDTLRSLEAEVSYLKRFWAELQQAKRMQAATSSSAF